MADHPLRWDPRVLGRVPGESASLPLFFGSSHTLTWFSSQFKDAADGMLDDKEPHYMRGGQPGKFANKKGSILPLNLYDPFGFNKNQSSEKKERR